MILLSSSLVYYSIAMITTLIISIIMFGVYHKLSGKPKLVSVGPPTQLGFFFVILNFVGDHIYKPIFKKPLIALEPSAVKKRRLPDHIEEEIMGPTYKNFMVGVQALHNSLVSKDCFFTTTGQFALQQIVYTHVDIGSKVMKYLYEHKQKVRNGTAEPFKPVTRPLIIAGLPRTGSTLLFSLLAQHPKSRTLRNWEMFKPLPPPTKEMVDCDPRIDEVRKLQSMVDWIQTNFTKEFWKIHYYEAGAVEEELLIMMPNLMLLTHAILLGENSEFNQWYLQQEGKEFIYTFLKEFIELMGSNYYPESHWVMKTPVHSLYPEVLMKTFPDAMVVVPHRDPASVVPSWTKLCTYVLAHYYDEKDSRLCFNREDICRNTLSQMSTAADRFSKYREDNPSQSEQFFDVYYHDLVKDPIGVVKQICQHYDLEYSDEFEQNMKKWLADNQLGKHGRTTYSLKEYNVPIEDVYEKFADYISQHPKLKIREIEKIKK